MAAHVALAGGGYRGRSGQRGRRSRGHQPDPSGLVGHPNHVERDRGVGERVVGDHSDDHLESGEAVGDFGVGFLHRELEFFNPDRRLQCADDDCRGAVHHLGELT